MVLPVTIVQFLCRVGLENVLWHGIKYVEEGFELELGEVRPIVLVCGHAP